MHTSIGARSVMGQAPRTPLAADAWSLTSNQQRKGMYGRH
jgi:hypothetical protein